jgi:hypothetical protein
VGPEIDEVIKAVLDTNIIVSALIMRGQTNQLVEFWQREKFIPIVCKEIMSEYLRVLTYPKFELSTEEIKNLIESQLIPFTQPVVIRDIPEIIHEDPSDNIFLACADAGKCQYLVSGDQHLLVLKHYKKIPIIPVKMFISKLVPSDI